MTVKSWQVAEDFIIFEDEVLIECSCCLNSALAEKDQPKKPPCADTLTPKDSLKLLASFVVVASNVVVQDGTRSIIHPYGT